MPAENEHCEIRGEFLAENPSLLRDVALSVGDDDPRLISIVRYFARHSKPKSDFRFGLEIEHLLTYEASNLAVSFADISKILLDFVEYFNENNIEHTKDSQNGHLLGLATEGIGITLEPGSQLEFSVGAFATPKELEEKYNEYRALLDSFASKHGFTVQTIGYQPKSKCNNISIIPKSRYFAMDSYLSKTGRYGHNMMRCSASTQVSIDYESEQDCIDKLRVAEVLGPILCYLFSNTPYFEGETNPYTMLRVKMWDDLDPVRCSAMPYLFDPDFSWEKAAKYALSAPLMVANMLGTPEFMAQSTQNPQNLAVFATTKPASEIYPRRELNDYEIEHILSTFFFDVRLKGYVELRTCDSLPITKAIEYAEVINRNFYNSEKLQFWVRQFESLTEQDVIKAKDEINDNAESAVVFGKTINEWKEML